LPTRMKCLLEGWISMRIASFTHFQRFEESHGDDKYDFWFANVDHITIFSWLYVGRTLSSIYFL
jgi:hypothetical protein